MAGAASSARVSHGADVAQALGWPSDRIGFLGALGGLIDIGAPARRPKPFAVVLVSRRAKQMRGLEARMRERRELAIRR